MILSDNFANMVCASSIFQPQIKSIKMLKMISRCLLSACILLYSNAVFSQTCATSDLSAASAGIAPSLCGTCDGNASVAATGGTPPYSYLWSTGENTSGIGASQTGTPLCINTGGVAFNASTNIFTDDQYFSGGTTFTNAIAIANTSDDALFQDERFVGNGGFFNYNIPVTNGNYLVELYFAEIFFGTSPTRPGGVGSRLFDVSIEGALVLDDYDIFLDAGGAAIAIIKTFNTNVSDGTLNILFDGVVNNAKINALCVTPVSASGLCAGEYFVTVTDAIGCTATATVSLGNGACADGNDCTTDACENEQCVYTPVICDDGDACTTDACSNGVCAFTPIPDCGDPCANILCDDEDLCTSDACVDGECVYTPLSCNDNDLCTTDNCFGTQCIYIPIDCDDGDACTIDECSIGQCFHNPIAGCGDPCTITVCFDGDACTADACSNGQCVFTPIDCNDNDLCTNDACAGGCLNIPLNCDDGDICTVDNCFNGACSHTVIPGCSLCANVICNDNDVCTADACSNGLCVFSSVDCDDNNPCTNDACVGGCVSTPINCDDNNLCTNDACVNGCENIPLNCDDGDACTSDACDNGQCVNTPLDCNDNNLCTDDACAGGCINTPLNCDDGDACTTDACDNGQCTHTPISGCGNSCANVNCNDNNVCTTDACFNGQCVYTSPCDDGDLCTVDYCSPEHHHGNHHPGNSYTCRIRPVNCDDRDDCTTDECVNGVCVNTPLVCDDNDVCTEDECKRGRCKYKEIKCDDNDACTIDACGAGGCSNTPRDCDDGNPCTIDLCASDNNNHGSGHGHGRAECVHLPIVCDDNDVCTSDACDNAGNCMNTVIPNCCRMDGDCDDEDACTSDKCLYRVCRSTSSTLEISEVAGFCQNGNATLQPSETGDSYLWSTGETTFTIEGMPDSTYSVTITQASGCVKTASTTVSPREELLSSYVILAEEEIKMSRNTVYSGGAGITDRRGDAKLRTHTMITAPGTFLHADDIQISSGSQVTTMIPSPADVELPAFETNPYCSWSGSNVIVQQNQNIILTGSVYGKVSISNNAKVTFTSPDLNIHELYLKDNVTVKFAECTRMKICKKLRLGKNNVFNPDSADVIVYVEEDVDIESGAFVHASIYVKGKDFKVHGSTANNPGRLTGLFIAEKIDAKDYTYWYANPNCDNACSSTQQLVALKTESGNTVDAITADLLQSNESNAHLSAYPNPFSDRLHIQFMLNEDAEAKLELLNLAGQRLSILFDGNVSAGAMQKVEYASDLVDGMVIYRLQTKSGIYYGKAIKVQ